MADLDQFSRLRQQRSEHMSNARWWKHRYKAWGGFMSLQWFLAEARCHRMVSRSLWKHGVN